MTTASPTITPLIALAVPIRCPPRHDVYALEAHLSSRIPRLAVYDRSVVLSTVKHMGRLLDAEGRSVGVVAADLWSDR